MDHRDRLATRLANWKHQQMPAANDNCLSEEQLYALTTPDGYEKIQGIELKHLSTCPKCIETWATWTRAVSDVGDAHETTPDIEMSYGVLKAAATEGIDAMSLKSQCGRFAINLLPQLDAPDKAMATIEIVDDNLLPFESARVTVHDARGQCVIRGILQNGRLARTVNNLQLIDLSTWSITIEKEPKA